jgi:hypothetical protein
MPAPQVPAVPVVAQDPEMAEAMAFRNAIRAPEHMKVRRDACL